MSTTLHQCVEAHGCGRKQVKAFLLKFITFQSINVIAFQTNIFHFILDHNCIKFPFCGKLKAIQHSGTKLDRPPKVKVATWPQQKNNTNSINFPKVKWHLHVFRVKQKDCCTLISLYVLICDPTSWYLAIKTTMKWFYVENYRILIENCRTSPTKSLF